MQKNEYLNSKLQDCQNELIHIQNEIKISFESEEEKQNKLFARIIDMEQIIKEREVILIS